jgi:hypothetical protein
MKTYQGGETAQAYLVNLDHDNEAEDADSVTLTIFDPDGEAIFSEQAMTKLDTGEYTHDYDIPEAADKGVYTARATVNKDGHVTKVYGRFRVK